MKIWRDLLGMNLNIILTLSKIQMLPHISCIKRLKFLKHLKPLNILNS